MNPDLWIVLEPSRIFLWPLQPKRRWTWRVISPVGYTHVRGQAWGRDRALAEAHHAVRHLPQRPPGPKTPDPGMKEHSEAYAVEVIPARGYGGENSPGHDPRSPRQKTLHHR